VLNYVPWHEGIWGSGGIAVHILNLGNNLKRVGSFTLRSLYPQKISARLPFEMRLIRPLSRAGRSEENSALSSTKFRFHEPPPHIIGTIPRDVNMNADTRSRLNYGNIRSLIS
jgi:hypothetical protein